MHEHIESSRNGASALAKAASDNPREMLIKLIEQHKDSKKEDLFRLFRDHLEDEPGYRRAVEWYFFINMYEYAVTNRSRTRDPVERAEAKAQNMQDIESIKTKIIMLDFPMTNGKLLGDCTGADLSTMSNRYQKLAERVGKAKTVRAVLTEDQVKAILK